LGALDEMTKVLSIYNCKAETVLGPAGIGDFIATAYSKKSRNRTIGLLFGLGMLKNVHSGSGILAEGLRSILRVQRIARENEINTPILDFVNDVCSKQIPSSQALRTFWRRYASEHRAPDGSILRARAKEGDCARNSF